MRIVRLQNVLRLLIDHAFLLQSPVTHTGRESRKRRGRRRDFAVRSGVKEDRLHHQNQLSEPVDEFASQNTRFMLLSVHDSLDARMISLVEGDKDRERNHENHPFPGLRETNLRPVRV